MSSALMILSACSNGAGGDRAGERPAVTVVELSGAIGPITARYLEGELEEAERQAAELVVIRLDTPGGLERSMRDMTRAILASPVPVAVHVAPSGARAASAGVFLTLAAHVAAMAPGTNLGAAHPVAAGGASDDDPGLAKATEDAAALARAIAQQRGRNAGWAERAVRESVSLSAEEALRLRVIDLVVADLDALLARLDGGETTTSAGTVTLRLADARVERRAPSLAERILQAIADPNVAYLLFTLAFIGIVVELYSPGLGLPGALGVISLLLALAAFGSLPVNGAGLLLLALGLGLLAAELHTETAGVLGVGGVAAFVLGSLFLYDAPGPPGSSGPAPAVSLWLVGVLSLVVSGVVLVVVRAVLRAQRSAPSSGIEALVERIATASSRLAPTGTVVVDGESWTARSTDGAIDAGEEVAVVGVDGVTLEVTRAAWRRERRGPG